MAIRVRVLGKDKSRISWKVLPPRAFSRDDVDKKVPNTIRRLWKKHRNAFYVNNEKDLVKVIKFLSEMIIAKRRGLLACSGI